MNFKELVEAGETDLGKIAAFFEGVQSPNTKSQTADVASKLNDALSAAEDAIPSLAKDLANELLTKIPQGEGYDAIADGLIDQVSANLLAAKSGAAPAPKVDPEPEPAPLAPPAPVLE